MPLNGAEELIAGRLAKQFGGRRRIIPGRAANLTRPLPGRGRCQYRNACSLGCPYGAYFSTQSSTLPAAAATGRLTLKTSDRDRRENDPPRAPPAARDRRRRVPDGTRRGRSSAPEHNSAWLLMRSVRDVARRARQQFR
jgi:hypothetical protein